MKYTIHIEAAGIKENVRSALTVIESVLPRFADLQLLLEIIVPDNFDKTINHFTNNHVYARELREGWDQVRANAWHLDKGGTSIIVFHRDLFTIPFESEYREFVILHEFGHVIDSGLRHRESHTDDSSSFYLSYLDNMYSEYVADYFAYTTLRELHNENTKIVSLATIQLNNHAETLIDRNYYEFIRSKIRRYEPTQAWFPFLKTIRPVIQTLNEALIHFSTSLRFSKTGKTLSGLDSFLATRATFALVEYIESKHSEQSNNLGDGINVVKNYMSNFGFKLKDKDSRIIGEIMDIRKPPEFSR